MSRYTDADAIKNIIRSGVSTDTEADQEYVCERIDEAPSIDIVHCGECKYGEYRADFDDYECHSSGCGLVYEANDFCSYGERNTNEN